MKLIEKIPSHLHKPFQDKMVSLFADYSITYDDLMHVFSFETAGTFDPSIKNPKTGAIGLIQFMPSTLKSLGRTVKQMEKLGVVGQLDVVEEYLRPYKSKMLTFYDLYFAVFYPKAIGQQDDFKIGGSLVADQNDIFDLDDDGQLLVGEVKKKLQLFFPEYLNGNVKESVKWLSSMVIKLEEILKENEIKLPSMVTKVLGYVKKKPIIVVSVLLITFFIMRKRKKKRVIKRRKTNRYV